jgi:transketolase C-terminal domain/subunit
MRTIGSAPVPPSFAIFLSGRALDTLRALVRIKSDCRLCTFLTAAGGAARAVSGKAEAAAMRHFRHYGMLKSIMSLDLLSHQLAAQTEASIYVAIDFDARLLGCAEPNKNAP